MNHIKNNKISNHKCRVCNQTDFKIWGKKDDQVLYQCTNCQLVFFFPYPTQEELDIFYNSNYHNVRGYDGNNKAGELRKRMYLLDVKEVESIVPIKGKFLDVGCAEGVFLTFLNSKWEKFGIDVSKEAISRASEKPGIKAYAKDISEVEDNFYDVIHLRGVFEHILFPDEFISIARKKLKTGGYLIISTTPNISGIVPSLFRERYKLVLPNEHVNYFSPVTISHLAKNHGFSIEKITFPYFNTPYSSFLKDLFSIPVNYFQGKASPPFWKNILSAYLIKK
jgi:2-polyprenyl-3-methyl-5-hydroxy-6-metoxy-1,4-benzoquinol methylase